MDRRPTWAAVAPILMCLMTPASAFSDNREAAIIPRPASVTVRDGAFTLKPDTIVVAGKKSRGLGKLLSEVLGPATGFSLKVKESERAPDNSIELRLDPASSRLGDEGYRLEVTQERILINASAEAGLFYGIQSLRQLLPPAIFGRTAGGDVGWTVPCLSIEDRPRFRWRGAMMDVSRHFMPKEFVKKFIDLLALHKMNVFHWHLTDDQGWRIEIKKYPRLTQIASRRKETRIFHERQNLGFDGTPHGGFYTQDEIKEIVRYARERHITIVPEIEMPGHAQAAIAAYPELGNTGEKLEVSTVWGIHKNIFNPSENTIRFLQDVLEEVIKLFPGTFIHVGGDEAVKDQWQASPQAQARIKELGLKDEHELQSYFIRRMDEFLTAKGRRLVGWDEILEGGLAPGATVMSWRGSVGGIAAAKAGHDVVMAPNTHTYFDYYQSREPGEPLAIGGFLPLETVYQFDPIPSELSEAEARHVLGAQGQLWTEYIPSSVQLEYMAFPRLVALAEVGWTPNERKDYPGFTERLRLHVERLRLLGVNYRPIER